MNAERNLWIAHIYAMVDDAIGVFKLPDVIDDTPAMESFDNQYEKIRKRLKEHDIKIISREQFHQNWGGVYDTNRARHYITSGDFGGAVEAVGYDSLFVNKIFDLVQYAITLEKKLYDEFKRKD